MPYIMLSFGQLYIWKYTCDIYVRIWLDSMQNKLKYELLKYASIKLMKKKSVWQYTKKK